MSVATEQTERRRVELFALARGLGLTDECAREMVAEHIARHNERSPRYVLLGLNRASGSINAKTLSIACKKTQKFLDRKFGFNSENVHEIEGVTVNRHKLTGAWYVAKAEQSA